MQVVDYHHTSCLNDLYHHAETEKLQKETVQWLDRECDPSCSDKTVKDKYILLHYTPRTKKAQLIYWLENPQTRSFLDTIY